MSPSAPRTDRALRRIVAALMLAALLSGCSDIYYDRRETIALSGGDSIAANAAEQIRDPWPAQSGNVNIAANGEKMQAAVQRYRTGKVIAPVDSSNLQASSQAQTPQAPSPASPTPPAPVSVSSSSSQ
jgi:hypothetical protein